MSAITRKNIEKVAHLARLAVSEQEITAYTHTLSNILQLVDQMNAIDTDGIIPMAHPLDIAQPMRADSVTEHNSRELLQSVADPAAVKSGLYIVPKAYDN